MSKQNYSMKQRLEILINDFWENTDDIDAINETLEIAKNQEQFNKFFLTHYITPDIFHGHHNANDELFKYDAQNNLIKLEKQSQVDLITKYYDTYGFKVPQKTITYYEKTSSPSGNIKNQFYYDPKVVEMLCCKYLALAFINDYSKDLYKELKQKQQQLKGK
ncbi:hypothetical protein GE118_00445 [Mycoplasma sp. NEAQ87857]|uniref:hypothetical protein n=1 Tax=Mycoplasma sp. NEAQ87857 TaxID=2683967 RepID=UPI0013180C0E|nr:hypothetical protein [Mycoplasma sp. NEAQ87857]QGZ97273.1 hypothetical protein GE118_00445 [Mycoplasma sp. NEAQ87857]